ncbi:hypothetical protein MLD38_025347 [Melastoma candidum]|uniref:Uncharacterized protein n=1 Tax=Melastoma candidum TaxID=119954 RepID=A0ACB9NY70_9MYRT|nr:hypothetical protein MLD38_025347 [Melastoma candidum]
MGYLLKEALKTMCGVNRWDYAVFWKIGCHNPKLLIWEECYYESPPSIIPQTSQFETNQALSGGDREGCLAPIPRLHASEKIQLLVDAMMVKNQIIVMGEGIIGQAAFTGDHLWILSGSLSGDSNMPELLSQLHHQFSAGIQTIAVIPVKPHGLVQLGSSLALMENVGFVNEVRSFILQLGVVPGALLLDNYLARDAVASSLPMPPPSDMSRSYHCMDPNDSARGSLSSGFAISHDINSSEMANRKMGHSFAQDEVISSRLNHQGHFQSVPGLSRVNSDHGTATVKWQRLLSDTVSQSSDCDYSKVSNKAIPSLPSAVGSLAFDVRKFLDSAPLLEGMRLFNGMDRLSALSSIRGNGSSGFGNMDNTSFADDFVHLEGIPLLCVNSLANNVMDKRSCSSVPNKMDSGTLKGALKTELEDLPSKGQILSQGTVLDQCDRGNDSTISTNLKNEDQPFACPLGDDLFDIFGGDYKQKILGPHLEKVVSHQSDVRFKNWERQTLGHGKAVETFSDYFPSRNDVISESCTFEGSGCDNLLDAIVKGSSSKQCSDDNTSSKTTLTKASCPSVPSSSLTYTHFPSNSNQLHRSSVEFSRPLEKSSTSISDSDVSGHRKERTYSRSNNSLCGSQISSWVEQCHIMKHENSVPSGYSKRPASETVKPSRKRLKPGENPKPRPKDRQMIQDRLKELRELVPSGAKCSIDALLERTIKHMLFLQSVTKHADKLKLTGESKIRDKEGGLVLKDNFEGGATWAFEVGSQSMICPIIVEDLNCPRQMLVEMLCQERGLFLEIADAIRGMGLTILKGVMEAREGKIWAQFAVEAHRDVMRMEIFMSLVHLLEKTGESSPGSANALKGT